METNQNIKLYISFDDTIEEIFIDKFCSIEELKLIIESKTNIPSKEQILFYKKYLLKNEDTLVQYNISNNKVIKLKIKKNSNTKFRKNENELNIQRKNNNNIYNKKNSNDNSESTFLGLGSDIVKTISNVLNSPKEVHNFFNSPICSNLKDNYSTIKELENYDNIKEIYNGKTFNNIKAIVDIGSNILTLISGRKYQNYEDYNNNDNNNYQNTDSSDDDEVEYNMNYKNNNHRNNNFNYKEDNNNYKQKYKNQLKKLNEMGFNEDNINLSLLVKFNGDIEKCINDYYN